jgi:hypothetical protein
MFPAIYEKIKEIELLDGLPLIKKNMASYWLAEPIVFVIINPKSTR